MPIKSAGLPWVFIPELSIDAKVLLVMQMGFMIRYFGMMGCKANSYVFTYLQEIKKEIKLSNDEIDKVCSRYDSLSIGKYAILKTLSSNLSTNRQKSYCKDVLNTCALHISNEVKDWVTTKMLNDYIDEYIDTILS